MPDTNAILRTGHSFISLSKHTCPALKAQLVALGTELPACANAIDGGWAPIQWITNIPLIPLAGYFGRKAGTSKWFRFVPIAEPFGLRLGTQ